MNQIKKRDLAESVVARLIISTISALIVAVNLNSFVQAGDLFPGGFTGLTRLIMRCAWEFAGVELPFGPINIAINALPALFCLKYVGKRFTLWSCFVIVLTSIFTDLVPSFPITEDPLLVAVFGGLINGVSIGICLYVRITSGGTDFIAIPLMERWNVSTWNYILAGNVVMLLIAGVLLVPYLFGYRPVRLGIGLVLDYFPVCLDPGRTSYGPGQHTGYGAHCHRTGKRWRRVCPDSGIAPYCNLG